MELALPNDEGRAIQPTAMTRQTFAALYEATFDKLYSVVRYQVSDDATADDITAQVYERALRGITRFDPDRGTFSMWLFGIARNTVREWRRSQRGEVSLEVVSQRPDPQRLPEEVITERERTDSLLNAVSTLKPREQEIIALKFGAGLNNREIAPIMDLSESNVGTILYRALGRLRQEMSDA
jgi:RNA polymerase sigma-70 factor (ECF subfamily)